MATFSSSSYLDISNPPCFMASSLHHNLLNSPVPLILPRRSSDNLDAHFDEHDFQSNHLDSRHRSSNTAPSLSGLGIRNLNFSKDLESNGYSQGIPPVPHTQINLDHRYGRRTPRVESMYDTLNEALDPFMRPLDNSSSIPSTWSFSSVIKSAELAADEAVYEMQSTLSLELGLGDLETTSNLLDTEDQVSWAFSPATPRTFASDFITQFSANDPTFKQTTRFSEICFDNTSQTAQIFLDVGRTQTTYNFHGECSKTSATMNLIPELLLSSVDINMCNANLQNSCIGVNPADILSAELPSSPSLTPLYLPYISDTLSTNQPVDGDFFRQDNVTNTEYLDSRREWPIRSHDIALPASACVDSQYSKQASDDEHSTFHSPTSSDYSPSLKSPVLKQTFSMRANKRRISRAKSVEEFELTYPDDHTQDLDLPVNLGTPVLDAHRGVELEELKAKAERYRLRNQGRDYDKRWLISFAGKLSMRGELVEEFRCYITGCQQVNKRRDHILIHVGAHLDQRPFKCRHCSSRFLRKNECKRHELSHTGIRPYSCHLCPPPATTFVRQDLLKRHMKRTHRLDLEKVDKENSDTYRPKKKART